MMSDRTVIIDLQGFQLMTHQFIPKEMFAIDLDTGRGMSHHVFKEPYALEELCDKDRQTVFWLTNKYHGLSWSGIGNTHLGDLQDVIDQVTYGASKVLCKGVMKRDFLRKYVRCEVEDLGGEIPSLRRLSIKTMCTSHNFESCHCAMTNGLYMYHYLRFTQTQ